MFPQEPYWQVSGCTHNLTQTTQVQTRYPLPVARVLGDYYRPFLAIGHHSLFGSLTLTGTACRYVRVERHRLDHARTREAKDLGFSSLLSAYAEGAGQRALTVPTSTTTLYAQFSTQADTTQYLPAGSDAFIPSRERRRDFPRRFVKEEQYKFGK